MSIIILCMFLPIIALAVLLEKKIDSPMVLFPLTWGIISFLASLRLYSLVDVSTGTYIMIFLGTVAFFFGCYIVRRRRIINFIAVDRNEKIISQSMMILQLISLIVFILSSINAITLLRSGLSINDIYNMRIQMSYKSVTALTSNSSFLSIVLEYFARPVLAICIPYSIIRLLKNKQKLPIILTISMLVLSFINRGNRLDVICFLLTIIFSFRLINLELVFSVRQKCYIATIATLGIVLIILLSNLRGSFDLGKTFYTYFCGNVPLADIKLASMGNDFKNTYFATSLQGVLRFFNQIAEMLNLGGWDLLDMGEKYADVETAVSITTSGGLYNAFVGPFYFFYCDAGWIGVFLYSFINGCIAEHVYNEAFTSVDTIMWILYLIIIVRGIIFSFYNYLLVSIMYGMSMIILLILGKISKN